GEAPGGYFIEFELRAFPRKTFPARVFFMSNRADPLTHMFEAKAFVPPSAVREILKKDDGDILPGYTARIRAPLPAKLNAIVVPEESIRHTERGNIVFRPRPANDKDLSEG